VRGGVVSGGLGKGLRGRGFGWMDWIYGGILGLCHAVFGRRT